MSALLKRFWTDHRLASVTSLALLFLGLLIKPWTLVLVLAVAFGGPLLQRLESFSTSPFAGWRRSNWVALALLVGAALLALTGKSGGQGALILALLPVAWVLVTDRGVLRGTNSAATGPATRAAIEPGITAPPAPDPDTAPPAVQTQAQTPLAGNELLNRIRELGDIGKSDLVRACGYVSTKADGGERLNFTAFYEALLEAKGASLGSSSSQVETNESISESNRGSDDDSLPSAEEIAAKVITYLDEIVDENIDDFDSDGSYKVRPDYGYGKFYLDSVDGSYDMSLQGLIHYIMHEEDIYEEFLNQVQLNAVQRCIDEYPEAIYAVDTSEGNGEEVESLLDDIYYRCINHVAKRLKSADLDIEAFADYLSEDEDGEDDDNSDLDYTGASTSEDLRQTEQGETALTKSESKPLGINNSAGAFSLSVIKSKISKPDDDGDISIDLELSLESHSDEDVELVGSKLVVLTASGLPLLEREDEHDLLITNGSTEVISLYSGYFKASQIAGSPASETQVLVQLTPCGCRFTELPVVEIPTSGEISGIPEKIEVQPEIQLQGFSILRSKPDDEGNCQLEFKGLVTSGSKSALSKLVVSIRIQDRNGREIESTEWSDKVSPSSTVCLDTSLWGIKPSRLEGAKAHVSFKSFHPLGNQELSWCVGSKPKPTEADVSQRTSGQRGLEEQASGTPGPADRAGSLPAKVMENATSNNFDLAIKSARYSSPDEDGDTRYEVGYSVINQSDQTIELLLSRLFVLHPSGLVVATTQDESEDMAESGESISATSSTWGTSVKELDGDASSAQLMLQVTACSCSFVELGEIECPASGRATTLEPSDQDSNRLVVEAITITAEPPDEGECCIRIKALVRNKTDLSFPRAVLSTKLMSASGRELDDTYSQEEIHPNSQIVLEDSFWGVKENRINSAKLQFSLKAFAAVDNSTIVTRDLSLED